MGWFERAAKLKEMVGKEKTNQEDLKVRGVCIHGDVDCVRCAAGDYEAETSSTEQNWQALDEDDLRRVIMELPSSVITAMKIHAEEAVIAGGFLRAIIGNESIRDIDVFVRTEKDAMNFVNDVCLTGVKRELHYHAVIDGIELQVIWRYKFEAPIDVPNDFDYTVSKAALWFSNGDKKIAAGFKGVCHERFYRDLARKELVYVCDRGDEQFTGFPRLLKYTTYGYKIGPKSLAAVITRLCCSLNFDEGFEGLQRQLEAAYTAGGTDVNWEEVNKKYTKPKPPTPARSDYSYGS